MDKLGPYDLNTIITGDARELAREIPDESVDLIFTDPVYDRIDDYRWLIETAERILKPNRALLVWFGCGSLQDIIYATALQGMTYRWLLEFVSNGTPLFYGSLGVKTQKCLWFDKGKTDLNSIILDATNVNAYQVYDDNVKIWKASDRGGAKLKGGLTDWGKDIRGTTRLVEAFTPAGGLVLDPFTGGGTVPAVCKMLGRRYLAFEIEPETAERARERVLLTQPPLFVLQPEQIELAIS